MPLRVPVLDDRTFDQLAAEARALIRKDFPAWTDHNPSDPGITLLELFSFLIEAAIYQINRVPERSLEHFANLVGIQREQGEAIGETLRRALESLKAVTRGVVKSDLETLAQRAAPNEISRALVSVEVPEPATPNVVPNDQMIKVVIVPATANGSASATCESVPIPTDALREEVFGYLNQRRLITSRLQVVGPQYTSVTVDVTVVRTPGPLDKNSLAEKVTEGINRFLSPLAGGADGTGWKAGHPLYRSELYQSIQGIPGVDHVKQLLLNGDATIDELQLSPHSFLICVKELTVGVVDE